MDQFNRVIFFTTEQGGIMQPWWSVNPEADFAEMKETGTIQLGQDRDPLPPRTPLAMVALATVDELQDFRLVTV